MVVAVGKGGHKHEGQHGGGGGAEGFSARAPRSLDFLSRRPVPEPGEHGPRRAAVPRRVCSAPTKRRALAKS